MYERLEKEEAHLPLVAFNFARTVSSPSSLVSSSSVASFRPVQQEEEEREHYNKRSNRVLNKLLPPQRLVRSSVGDHGEVCGVEKGQYDE
jgi:hypothetical protein